MDGARAPPTPPAEGADKAPTNVVTTSKIKDTIRETGGMTVELPRATHPIVIEMTTVEIRVIRAGDGGVVVDGSSLP